MSNTALLARLKELAGQVDRTMQEDLGTIASPLLLEVVRHAIFQGGKRIRPLLTYTAARLINESPPQDTWRLAMTFEYLHAASLLHDDVIDGSDFRRGKETANRIWGISPVILAGDYLHARAMTIAGLVCGPEGLGIIGAATAAMVEAEFLQMQTARENNDDEANYFEVLRGKTAALIAAACETGILHGGGSRSQREALRTYGTNLGLAFQIIDDLLDYLGDPGKTGKAVGNDFSEGKMTLPLIHALNHCSRSDRQFLLALLEADRVEREKHLEKAAVVIDRANGFGYARRRAENLIEEACRGLLIFPENLAREQLFGLAGYVLTRDK